VGNMQAEGGAAGFVGIVAQLLAATFSGGGDDVAASPGRAPNMEGQQPGPFPGTT
jgi:hypothetical protein